MNADKFWRMLCSLGELNDNQSVLDESELNDSTPQEKNTPRDDGYCYAVGLSRLVQNTCENFLGAPPYPQIQCWRMK